MTGSSSFIIRSHERGYNKILSQMLPSGASSDVPIHSTYLAGHPDTFLKRYSSFNFHEYQQGMEGFGKIKVFGDEIFSPNGCGYNMHPHHNFIIMAFVLEGELTHINTIGSTIDVLKPGDYYIFSAGSGGKHCELNIDSKNELNVIYVWILPDKLYSVPTYFRNHFDPKNNTIVPLIGNHIEGALPVEQDFKVSRLVSDKDKAYTYEPTSEYHGMYFFVVEGSIDIEQNILDKRDSMGIHGVNKIEFHARADKTDIIIVETAM